MTATQDGGFWRRSPELAQALPAALDALPGELVEEESAVDVVAAAREQLRATR